jgi:hypothetical protein
VWSLEQWLERKTKYSCVRTNIAFSIACVYISGADPELRNYDSSHFKRPFIRDETELEINTM